MATYKVFFTDAGVPATGLAPTIPVLKRVDTQDDITPPTVYEIGGGWYTFEHEPAQAQVGYVDGTATLADADRYIPIDMNVEDIYLDAPVAVIDTNVDTALANLATVDGIVDTIAVDVAGLDGAAMRGTDSAMLASSYTAPANADITSIKAKTDNLPSDPASNTQVGTRMATFSYTAPANPDVSRLASLPVLSEIEASTVLSKDATVAKESSITTLLGNVTSILEDTGTTLDGKLDTLDAKVVVVDGLADDIKAKTELIPAAPAAVGDIPTSADVANAVWDSGLIDHTSNETAGEAIQAMVTAAGVTPAQVAAAVWAKIVTGAITADVAIATLYNGWTSDAGVGSGAGAIASEITVNVGGSPVDGVEVWATTDEAGTDVVAGTLSTDAFGKVTFMLDAGTYFLWKQKSGVNFTNPETIVVTL